MQLAEKNNDSNAASRILETFLLLILANLLAGCALLSRGVPLPVTAMDRKHIASAERIVKSEIPLITHSLGRPVMVYRVAFDGTLNDAGRVPKNEQETVVASIARKIGARYHAGPGMQNPHFINYIDAAFGTSSVSIAREAEAAFFEQAAVWLDEDPETDIRIFVTGFSRGAAIARHFMNEVTDNWGTLSASRQAKPHFYAILFDTVSTGQLENLRLALPSSVDYLVHFVARDEARIFFTPIIDEEEESHLITKTFHLGGFLTPERLNLVDLPGSHSDVGSSYATGIGAVYRELSEQLLYKMGLIQENCWERDDHPYRSGKHDSRGALEMLLSIPPPNSASVMQRPHYKKLYSPLSLEQHIELDNRLHALSLANYERAAGITQIWETELLPSFRIFRFGNEIRVESYEPSKYIDGHTFEYLISNNIRRLNYRFLPPYENRVSSLILFDPIWDKLEDGRSSILSYSILERNNDRYLVAHVDNVFATSVRLNPVAPGTSTVSQRCVHNKAQGKTSPLKMFILRPSTQ